MICPPCTERQHHDCRIGCTCQHDGSAPVLRTADRHALAIHDVMPPGMPRQQPMTARNEGEH